MSQIVNWEYYSSLYSQIKAEEEFAKAEALAEKEVCSVIGPIRWAQISEETFGYEQLKDCICGVINKMAEDERIGLGRGISSASNDGYSETFVIQTKMQSKSELRAYICQMLSGTGLVGAY